MLRPMIVAPIPTSPCAMNRRRRPRRHPPLPSSGGRCASRRPIRGVASPPTPSGLSRLWFGSGAVPVERDREVVHARAWPWSSPQLGLIVPHRSDAFTGTSEPIPVVARHRVASRGGLGGEVVLLAEVRGAGGRGPELDDRGLRVAGQLEEVGAHGMQAVVVAELLVEPVEQREAGARARRPSRRRPPG